MQGNFLWTIPLGNLVIWWCCISTIFLGVPYKACCGWCRTGQCAFSKVLQKYCTAVTPHVTGLEINPWSKVRSDCIEYPTITSSTQTRIAWGCIWICLGNVIATTWQELSKTKKWLSQLSESLLICRGGLLDSSRDIKILSSGKSWIVKFQWEWGWYHFRWLYLLIC